MASPSRKDILEGVKRTLSHFHVMATGCGCALVQLQPLTGGSAGEMKPVRKTELGNRQRASGGPQGCVGRLSGRQHFSVHTHSLASRGFRSVGLTPQVWWDASCHCPDLLMGLSLKAEAPHRSIGSGNEDSPSWSGRTAGSSPIFQCFPVNCRCTWLCSSAQCLGTIPMLLEWALFWASAFCGQPRPPNPRHR